MEPTAIEVFCWVLLGASVLVLLIQEWWLSRRVDRERALNLRYPMFAVRDDLVRLVVRDRVSEDEEAWGATYTAISYVLKSHFGLTPLSHAKTYAKFTVARARDAGLRRELEHYSRRLRRLRTQVPEFGDVLDAYDRAFYSTLCARNRFWHMWALRLMTVLLTLVKSGLSAAVAVMRALPKESNEGRAAEMSYQAANKRSTSRLA